MALRMLSRPEGVLNFQPIYTKPQILPLAKLCVLHVRRLAIIYRRKAKQINNSISLACCHRLETYVEFFSAKITEENFTQSSSHFPNQELQYSATI